MHSTLNDSFTWLDYKKLDGMCDLALIFVEIKRQNELDEQVNRIINDSWEAKLRRWLKLKPISKETAEKEFLNDFIASMSYNLMYGEVYEVATRLKRMAAAKHRVNVCSRDYEILTSVI